MQLRKVDSLSSITATSTWGGKSERMRDLENSLPPSSLRLPDTGTGRRRNEERLGNDRAVSRVTGIKPTSTTYLHSVRSDRPYDMER